VSEVALLALRFEGSVRNYVGDVIPNIHTLALHHKHTPPRIDLICTSNSILMNKSPHTTIANPASSSQYRIHNTTTDTDPSDLYSAQHIGYNYTDWLHATSAKPVRKHKLAPPILPQSSFPTLTPLPLPPPNPDPEILPYIIITKSDTPVQAFDNFIRELDSGVGRAERLRFRQTYRTRLRPEQAEGLEAKYPFLMMCYANVCKPGDVERDESS